MALAELSVNGPIATLTLCRESSRNALNLEMLSDMHAVIDQAAGLVRPSTSADAPGPIVLILTGAGKSFCAGMDLKQVLGDPDAPLKLLLSLSRFALKLRGIGMVTIARVNGAAIGGGCGLTTVCDFAITHADAKLGFPEVDLGVCPAVVAPWLVRRVGAGRARSILLRGGLMSGKDAASVGLVSDCVESLDLLGPAVDALAAKLTTGGPMALRATKALLNELDGSMNVEIAERAAEISAGVLALPEAQAMLRAKLG